MTITKRQRANHLREMLTPDERAELDQIERQIRECTTERRKWAALRKVIYDRAQHRAAQRREVAA